MKILAVTSATIALALSGCAPDAPQMTQSEVDDLFAESAAYLDDANFQLTPDMPTSGTASYTGFTAIYDLENVTSDGDKDTFSVYVGEVTLDADFSANTLSGEATNFSETDVTWDYGSVIATSGQSVGEAATGTLSLQNGVISGANFNSLGLTGTLTGSDGTDVDFDLDYFGNFGTVDGSGADTIAGNGNGTMNSGSGDVTAWSFLYGTLD